MRERKEEQELRFSCSFPSLTTSSRRNCRFDVAQQKSADVCLYVITLKTLHYDDDDDNDNGLVSVVEVSAFSQANSRNVLRSTQRPTAIPRLYVNRSRLMALVTLRGRAIHVTPVSSVIPLIFP